MAEFNKAIGFVRKHEGGYCHVPGDSGGETYCGISRADNPNWEGWPLVDISKPLHYNQVIAVLNEMVDTYYYKKYWNGIYGDKISGPQVAGFLFDWYVNSGVKAIKKLQQLLKLKADGDMGPVTLKAVNAANEDKLFTDLKQARGNFYIAHVEACPKDAKFLDGWLRRVNDYSIA